MPRLQKRRSRREPHWSDAHLLQLRCGWDFFQQAWGDGRNQQREPMTAEEQAEREADMRACWDTYRESIIADEIAQHGPGSRPWAFWEFDHKRDESLPEWRQLQLLGEIDDATAKRIATKQVEHELANEYHGLTPFRRSLGWWLYFSPGRRDEACSELDQLLTLGVLTQRELTMLAGGDEARRAWRAGSGHCPQRYLSDVELKRLGLESKTDYDVRLQKLWQGAKSCQG